MEEWIVRQIEQQTERLVVAIHRWIFNIACDRRRRLRTFYRLVVVQLFYLMLLEWTNWQRYSHARAMLIVFLKMGLVLTTIVEYLAKIRVGWIGFEIDLAFFASMFNMFGNLAGMICVSSIARDVFGSSSANVLWLPQLFPYWVHYEIARWFIGIRLSASPISFQIRKWIPGQQHPQMLQLLIWNQQDRCELLLPNQWPANVPFIEVPQVPDYAWPTMEEAPWWIRMKLSENAAAAG